MAAPSPLESAIDRLYALPLDQFVASRNEVAKQFRGEDARAVRALAKPNIVAWALNQVYWSARPAFDRLVEAAARLREAQASGLLGRPSDLRGAGAAHREALGAALKEATGILEAAGHEVTPDDLRALTAAFEALPWEDPPGRLVRPPAPLGFAAFAGMTFPAAGGRGERGQTRAERPEAKAPVSEPERPAKRTPSREAPGEAERKRREREDEERRAREQQVREAIDAARREAAAAGERVHAAEELAARARGEERAARERLEAARRAVREAEGALRVAEREAASAEAAVRKAEAGLPRP
jgi:hypothetical protein